jgi:hypothetical protein
MLPITLSEDCDLENTDQKPERFTRRFPRRRFTQNTGLLNLGTYSIVLSLEIGEGGILIRSDHHLEVGHHVVVNFFISEKGFITVTGEVRYKMEESIFGLKFTNLPFESKRFIRDYIAEKTAAES